MLRQEPACYAQLHAAFQRFAGSYSHAEWDRLAEEGGSDPAAMGGLLLSAYAGWVCAAVGSRKAEVVVRRAGLDGQGQRGTRTVAEELGLDRSTVRAYEQRALGTLARRSLRLRSRG